MPFLGIVKYLTSYARIKPLYEVDEQNWRKIEDPIKEFPPDGLVYWNPANKAIKGGFFFFHPVKIGGDKDQYKVSAPEPAIELLSFRQYTNIDKIRQIACNGYRYTAEINSHIMLWGPNEIIGPVKFIKLPNTTEDWIIDKNTRHTINIFYYTKNDIQTIKIDKETRYVFKHPNLGEPDNVQDWDDNKSIAKRALRYVKEHSNKVELPKKEMDIISEYISETGTTPKVLLDQYRLEKTKEMIKDTEITRELIAELCQELMDIPNIQVTVQTKVEQKIEEIQGEVKNKIQESLSLEQEKVNKLKEENKLLEEKHSNLQKEIEKITLLQLKLASNTENKNQASKQEIKSITTTNNIKKIVDITELMHLLTATFRPKNIISISKKLHAAFCCKAIPVLTGINALDILQMYADVVAAGRIKIINISTTTLEYSELFGRVDYTNRRFIPHVSGLIDHIKASQPNTGYSLLVIEGINRAPTESYLLPFLQALRSRRELVLFHPTTTDEKDPYFNYARFTWPQNILLAMTLIEGATSLPLTPDLWADTILIQTDSYSRVNSLENENKQISEVEPTSSIFNSNFESNTDISQRLKDIIGNVGLFGKQIIRRIEEIALRYAKALQHQEKKDVFTEVVDACLVPSIASVNDEETQEDLIKIIESEIPENSFREKVNLIRKKIA